MPLGSEIAGAIRSFLKPKPLSIGGVRAAYKSAMNRFITGPHRSIIPNIGDELRITAEIGGREISSTLTVGKRLHSAYLAVGKPVVGPHTALARSKDVTKRTYEAMGGVRGFYSNVAHSSGLTLDMPGMLGGTGYGVYAASQREDASIPRMVAYGLAGGVIGRYLGGMTVSRRQMQKVLGSGRINWSRVANIMGRHGTPPNWRG